MDRIPFKKIPCGVFADAQLRLTEIIQMLEPYLFVLKPDERRNLVSTGENVREFIKLSHELAAGNPGLFPFFMKPAVFRDEYLFAESLWGFIKNLELLASDLYDLETLAGNHALQTALAFYDNVKIAAKRDIPGAKPVFDELKARFPLKKQKQRRAS